MEDLETKQELDLHEGDYKKGVLTGILISAAVVLLIAAALLLVRQYSYRNTQYSGGTSSSADASGDEENIVSELTLSNTLSESTLAKLNYIYAVINKYYYEDINLDDLIDGMFAGIVEGLGDKYSEYYTAEEYERLSEKTSGSYGGIGALFGMDDETGYPTVMFVYSDTPAEAAGLEAGDYVITVDDTDVAGLELEEVIALIRGEVGTDITISYVRDDEVNTVIMTREELELSTVTGQMLDDGVGYIRITSFSNATDEQFAEYADEFLDEGMTSLIIDLRNNGGGIIDGAAGVLDYLLPEGTVVYTVEERDSVRKDYTSDEETQLDIPLVVLVNGSSASASEIFAAAIRDFEWGTLLGTTTYGKGVYQSTIGLSDGSGIKVTSGKFYSPKGNNFDGVGIEPDVVLEYENLAGEDADYSIENDNQIEKAIEILLNE